MKYIRNVNNTWFKNKNFLNNQNYIFNRKNNMKVYFSILDKERYINEYNHNKYISLLNKKYNEFSYSFYKIRIFLDDYWENNNHLNFNFRNDKLIYNVIILLIFSFELYILFIYETLQIFFILLILNVFWLAIMYLFYFLNRKEINKFNIYYSNKKVYFNKKD